MARHGIKAGKTHLETYAGQPAVDALAELIWNGLDAEAKSVEVRLERGSLGDDAAEFVSRLWATDTGHGIEPVGADYCVVPGLAAFRYSLMRPWQRVDFTTRRRRGSAGARASEASGGCWSSERWGRCSL